VVGLYEMTRYCFYTLQVGRRICGKERGPTFDSRNLSFTGTRNVTAFNERRYFLACVILRPPGVGVVVKAVRLYSCC